MDDPVVVADVASEAAGAGARTATRHGRYWRDAVRRRMLAAADLAAAVAASATAIGWAGEFAMALFAVPAWLVLAKMFGLYDRDHTAIRHGTIEEGPTVLAWAAAGTALMLLILEFNAQQEIGGTQAMAVGGVAVIVSLVGRAIARAIWRRWTPPEVTLVIGDGELAASIRRKLELFPDMHLALAGEDESLTINGGDPVEHLGRIGTRIDRLIVASDRLEPEPLAQLAARCRELQVKLNVVSPLRGRSSPSPTFSRVADLRVFEYDTSDVSRSTRIAKRGVDVVVSAVGLLVTLPLLPLVALAIRLDSPGPVFFTQLRAGHGGRPFRMIKFRTMAADAEHRLGELVSVETLAEPMFKVDGDPRVTRVGRFLRRSSIDELPQLWNVLRGEMSLVGPRPEEIRLVRRYRPEHRFRLSVRPGMTGPMQVYGRGELTFAERLAVELDYVENVSISRDLQILARTLPTMVRGTGAF